MKCPHCSFDNRDDAAFCENCGEVSRSRPAQLRYRCPPWWRCLRSSACPTSLQLLQVGRAGLGGRSGRPGARRPGGSRSIRLRAVGGLQLRAACGSPGRRHGRDSAHQRGVRAAGRSYAMGPTERTAGRDRQQKKLAKKFTKNAGEGGGLFGQRSFCGREGALARRNGWEKERLRAAEAEAREQRRIAEEEAREARRAAEAAERRTRAA